MIGDIWFGDQASYLGFIDKIKLTKDPMWLSSMRGMWDEDQRRQTDDYEGFENRLLTRNGSTAILDVSGDLVNSKNWYDEYLGLVSYEEITEALAEAGEDEGTEQIIMNFSTGGGTANGIKSAADFIQYTDRNVKPVYGHTGSASFSAGYWLYSATRKGSVEDMGQLGSIGALNIHVSYKDMLDKEGIVFTVFREGEFKALGQPFEKLDQKTKDYFQERLSKANAFFLDAVVRNRNISLSNQSEWGEGKTHYGREAVAYGLADEVTTLHELLGRFTKTQSGDGRLRYGGNMPKEKLNEGHRDQQQAQTPTTDEVVAGLNPEIRENLSEEQIAQLSAGVSLEQVLGTAHAVEETTEGEELKDELTGDEVVDFSGYAEMTALKDQVEELTTKLEAAVQLNGQMKGIVLTAANAKVVAMGGTPVDMDFLDTANAVKYFEQVDSKFQATFKAGPKSKALDLAKPDAETGEGLSAVPSAYERSFALKKQQQK